MCKIIGKHPKHKTKISQLQHEIRSLKNKAQEEEAHLKSFTPTREQAKSLFFFIMRPRLKAQNQVKYANRGLMILQRHSKRFPNGVKTKTGDF